MNDKLKAYRDSLTPEQKVEALQRAQEARKNNADKRKANEHLYKLTYLEENHWQSLAKDAKYKMPAYNQHCTTLEMRKILRKLKVDVHEWLQCSALSNLQQWIDLNPSYTAYAFAGNILEWLQDRLNTHNNARI